MLAGSGTKTTVIGEEHVLLDLAAIGSYTLELDSSVLQAGDMVEVRVYLTTLGGAVPRCAIYESYEGVQEPDEYLKESDRLSVDVNTPGSAYRATLRQVTGTSRNFPWKVLRR